MWSDASNLEQAIAFCQRKLDHLLEFLYYDHPHLESMWPSEAVEDAIFFCGFGVVDEPLPRYQLARCDMGQRLVVVNSQMNRFVHKWTNLEILRQVTLAHELGHVILHHDEISDRVYRSYVDNHRFEDSRPHQKENEADLFGRLFLVPADDLLHQNEAQRIQMAFDERRDLSPGEVTALIKRLASRFKVNPTTIKARLADFGWLYHTRRGQNWSKDLRLRKTRYCE